VRTTRILLVVGCVGAIALGTFVPAKAQYYYPSPYASGPGNPCPMGYTMQGGSCQPYRCGR
jgi:hypothetical protein